MDQSERGPGALAFKTVTRSQMDILVQGVRDICSDGHKAGISQTAVAEHLFDVGRAVLACLKGNRAMADHCAKVAAAYAEAADEEDDNTKH